MARAWIGAVLLASLALLSGTGSAVAAPRSGDLGVLVAVLPIEGELDEWEVGFRVYDLESREMVAESVLPAVASSPTILHVGNPHTGDTLKVEVRVERE